MSVDLRAQVVVEVTHRGRVGVIHAHVVHASKQCVIVSVDFSTKRPCPTGECGDEFTFDISDDTPPSTIDEAGDLKMDTTIRVSAPWLCNQDDPEFGFPRSVVQCVRYTGTICLYRRDDHEDEPWIDLRKADDAEKGATNA